ncbi:MAG TPA: hypothetical protein VIK35_04035 [Verrucomicrobiae bacterium]
MFVVVFLILTIVSVFHFIYQGILLPSYRLQCRIHLFELRDKLRRLQLQNPALDEQAFCFVQESINCWVKQLAFDLFLLLKINDAIEKDTQFMEKLSKRSERIKNCNSEELKEIALEVRKTVQKIVILNSVVLFIYLLPLAFLAFCFRKFIEGVKRMACVSEWEMGKFVVTERIPT